MADARKLDSRRRCVFPERFSAGDVFVEERVDDESVTFRMVKPAEAPLKKVTRRKGRSFLKVPLDRDRVRAAIRSDRDGR